jgi:DNA-binding NtrC family response regulator
VRRILLLEDDDDLRASLRELLELLGARCMAVASVDEMKQKESEALGCDVALLDINLGRGVQSGLDGYRWLGSRAFKGSMVFLTGHARSHPLVEEAYKMSGVEVLEKPVTLDVLKQVALGRA